MDDITNTTDRQTTVQIDTANVTFEAPDIVDQDIEISYIEITPLSFNTDTDVVDQYQPCKSEDTYQNCSTLVSEYDDEDDKTSQHCTLTLKEDWETNLHTESSKTKEIESFIQTSGLKSADSDIDLPATNADKSVPGLMYPGSRYFKSESPLSECKRHDIKIAIKSEANISNLQTTTTRSEDSIAYDVKQEKCPPTYHDLQTISDNMKLLHMSELNLKTTSDKSDLDLDSTSTLQVSTSKIARCYVKLMRISSLDLLSQSGVLHMKVEDIHDNVKPGSTLKNSYRKSPTVSKPYKCQHSRFTHRNRLETHIRKHTGIKPYQCQHCGARFTKKCSLSRHILIHTGMKPYKCQHCDSRFTQICSLSSHTGIHTGIKPYQCQHCGATFTQKSSLSRHILIHTGIKPYKCHHCDATFTQKCHLSKHVRIHTGIKPYECQHCDATFAQKGYLSLHVRIHTGIKPYKCQHCGATFTQKAHLSKHVRIHTGIKPYKCQYCDATFAQKGYLSKHVRIHTGIKPYKCQHCDARFTQKGNLSRHIRIHTGIKPYTCDHCDARFTDKASLSRHVRIHTGIKPYKCQHCDARFTQKGSLSKHVRIHRYQTLQVSAL